jgi:hypothetical protein
MPVFVALTGSNLTALIDEEDADLVLRHRWSLSSDYAVTSVPHPSGALRSCGRRRQRSTMGMHRMVMGLVPLDGIQVDHINMNRLDNRKANLRLADSVTNGQNKRSEGRGASFHKASGKWEAHAKIEGKKKHLGLHETQEIALAVAAAYRAEHMPFSQEALHAGL